MLRAAPLCALTVLIAALANCLPSSTIGGLEFACDAGRPCQEGYRCWRGVCTVDAGWSLGTACADDDDCASTVCSSGVCCSRRCEGSCERCDLGTTGQCDPLPASSAGSPSCAPLRCDGNSGSCPSTCFVDLDCVGGTFCDGGACQPLQAQGDRCVQGGTCDSGLCVDGRCCDRSCTAACDACDVAGFEGTCRTSPLGRVGSPSCGAYACNGTSINCPALCNSDAGCAPTFSCNFFRVCQSKVETLFEPFNGTVLDAGTWDFYEDPGTSVDVNNRLEVTVFPWSGSAYAGIFTRRTYEGTNSQITAQLVAAGTQAVGSLETYLEYLSTDNQNRFGFDIYGNEVHTSLQTNGTYTEPYPPIPYNPNVHRIFRLRTDGGLAYWEFSADGGSFTIMGTTAVRQWMQTVYVELGSGIWSFEDAGSVSAWDNVRR